MTNVVKFRESDKVRIADMPTGQAFIYGERLFIKQDNDEPGSGYEACDVITGKKTYWSETTKATTVDLEIIVK